MRCYLLQCYNSLISLWNRQERQWNDVVQVGNRYGSCIILECCFVVCVSIVVSHSVVLE